ncbi:unnamed protein product [marine sediment metagenome]|uniref:Uncharacterized protein n=1 Tax=marine sediment metagenome TaxID=412755 RepID=X0SCN3_9ZZZZ
MKSITADSNRYWIEQHPLKWMRYLRRNHKIQDRDTVMNLIFNVFPDEGRKLIENFSLNEEQKKLELLKWIIYQPQITCGIFSDQRKGKDATVCEVFGDVIVFYKKVFPKVWEKFVPRFVTLGNVRNPPFVDEKEDMYFSFDSIPSGTKEKEVWIYSSEIEAVLPARGFKEKENTLFSYLSGTLAQNHQKLFGCSKLASKVDINFLRDMNVKIFKYISREKLKIEGVERVNILSELGHWLLPHDVKDPRSTLLAFDNQLFTVNYDLPKWWSDEYSEQFRDIPMDKVWDYIEAVYSEDMKLPSIKTMVFQKFRKKISLNDLKLKLGA